MRDSRRGNPIQETRLMRVQKTRRKRHGYRSVLYVRGPRQGVRYLAGTPFRLWLTQGRPGGRECDDAPFGPFCQIEPAI